MQDIFAFSLQPMDDLKRSQNNYYAVASYILAAIDQKVLKIHHMN
jgi:hypothetical protein